jgi:hypothetical protein
MQTITRTSWRKRLAQRWRDWISAERDPIELRSVDVGLWHPLWL